MQKIILILLTCTCFTYSLVAQHQQKLERIIHLIEHSDFTSAYLQAKKEMEAQVFAFKQQQQKFSPLDIAIIQKGYDETKIQFDKILDKLKKEFTSRKFRKITKRKPELAIEEALQKEFEEALHHYNEHCKKYIDALINVDNGKSGPLIILTVIGVLSETVNIINQLRVAKLEELGRYFEKHYAKEKRLKTWETI